VKKEGKINKCVQKEKGMSKKGEWVGWGEKKGGGEKGLKGFKGIKA